MTTFGKISLVVKFVTIQNISTTHVWVHDHCTGSCVLYGLTPCTVYCTLYTIDPPSLPSEREGLYSAHESIAIRLSFVKFPRKYFHISRDKFSFEELIKNKNFNIFSFYFLFQP